MYPLATKTQQIAVLAKKVHREQRSDKMPTWIKSRL